MTKRLIIAAALITGLAGGGIWYYDARNSANRLTPVTSAITRGDVIAKVEATGTLQPVTTVLVGSQLSGSIKALHADFNSQVRKGQVIAELDPSLFQTQVEQSRATLVKLQADADRAKVDVQDTQTKLRRAQELFDQKLIARTDLEAAQAASMQADASLKSAEAQVTQARAALNQNEVNLGHTIITAPIDGTVISRSVDVGQTVAASMQAPTLFTIAQDLTHMQVSAAVDESDIGRVTTGQKVTFRVDSYPERVFAGTVSQVRLDPKVDQNVVSYTTMIDVPNKDLTLKPGMTANVTIQIASDADVLRVPNAALKFRPTPELFAALGQDVPQPRATPRQTDVESTAGEGRLTKITDEQRAQVRAQRDEAADRDIVFGRVWVLRNGALQPVRLRTGVTDGAVTAVVEGDLSEGDEVVTGIADQASLSKPASASPLLPFGGRRGGGAAGAGAGRAGGAGATR